MLIFCSPFRHFRTIFKGKFFLSHTFTVNKANLLTTFFGCFFMNLIFYMNPVPFQWYIGISRFFVLICYPISLIWSPKIMGCWRQLHFLKKRLRFVFGNKINSWLITLDQFRPCFCQDDWFSPNMTLFCFHTPRTRCPRYLS